MSKQNISEVRQELARAHLIIALLSIISIVLLMLGTTLTIEFDAKLSTIAGVLLGALTLISVTMSFVLFKQKK
jgi:hypothetical protein